MFQTYLLLVNLPADKDASVVMQTCCNYKLRSAALRKPVRSSRQAGCHISMPRRSGFHLRNSTSLFCLFCTRGRTCANSNYFLCTNSKRSRPGRGLVRQRSWCPLAGSLRQREAPPGRRHSSLPQRKWSPLSGSPRPASVWRGTPVCRCYRWR